MGFLYDVGEALEWIADRLYKLWWAISDIPLLFNAFGDAILTIQEWFTKAQRGCKNADGELDGVLGAINNFLNWNQIWNKIRESWSFLDDVPGYVWGYILEWIKARWTWIDDVAGYVWTYILEWIKARWTWIDDIRGTITTTVGDFLKTQYSWITDFWGNVFQAIWDWFTDHFFPWIEDRAEQAFGVGVKVLELVW